MTMSEESTAPARRAMPAEGRGRCFCGAVRYEWRAEPLWASHCHCESCRRATSAPMVSWFGVANGAWSWTGAAPTVYDSSPGAHWSFCPRCGAHVAYANDRWPDETHFFAASMERPEDYAPTAHVHAEERLPWLHLSDGLREQTGALE